MNSSVEATLEISVRLGESNWLYNFFDKRTLLIYIVHISKLQLYLLLW